MVYIRRDLEKEFEKWIEEREILVIRGARQAGKTTLLMRIREKLLEKGVNDKNVVYVSFEDDISRIAFEENPRKFIESYITKEKTYFLLDEVQYIKDIGKKLKLVFDFLANSKIIVTGSSSFDLTSLGKYLVGRVIFFNLYPFSFREFLRAKSERHERIYEEYKFDFKERKLEKSPFIEELNLFLKEYLTYGSYPRVVLAGLDKKKELLKNMFITYIEKDLLSLYGNKHRDETVKLMQILAATKGIIKYESLSSDSNVNFKDLKQILSILQDSFTISLVRPFHRNLITELKKNPKIYFIDYGIRNYLSNKTDFDILYENFVYNELSREHTVKYWRTTSKTEVDFIIDDATPIPVEVKTTPKTTRALRSFIDIYRTNLALVTNESTLHREKIKGHEIITLPFVYL